MTESNESHTAREVFRSGQEQRVESVSLEHVLPPTPEAACAPGDRDAGLWALADLLGPDEVLEVGYCYRTTAAEFAIRGRLHVNESRCDALETRTSDLHASLARALSYAFPGFGPAQSAAAPLPCRYSLAPPVVQLACSEAGGEPDPLRPQPIAAHSDARNLLLPSLPLHKARLEAVLAMLVEHEIEADLTVHVRPFAFDGAALRGIGQGRARLETCLKNPGLGDAEARRADAYRDFLSLCERETEAVRVEFRLGLGAGHDPLLPELAARLLFGRSRRQDAGAHLNLSSLLLEAQPRPALTPAARLLAFSGTARAATPAQGDAALTIGRHSRGKTVAIGRRDLQRHAYLIGATGVGKSTLMADMIRQDVAAGRSVIVVDPHGDLFEEVRTALPRAARKRTMIADVADFDTPFSLNLLEIAEGPAAPIQRNFVCNQLIGILKTALYKDVPEAFGPMFEAYFRNAALLLMDADGSEASLVDFERLFGDPKYRRELLDRCRDETVVGFWKRVAMRAGGDATLENIAPYIVSKLTQFTGNPLIRPIIGARNSSLDFETLLSEGGHCLVNLAKGRVGGTDAALIGAVITTRLFAAALGRAAVAPERREPVRLYMDEFQSYTTDALGHMLAESRKFGLEVVLANQSLSQVGGSDGHGVAGDILANVANILAFRVGPADARALAEWFAPEITPLQLNRMPDFHFAARRLVNGAPAQPSILGPV